jgi:molecular chaperone DnaK
MERKKVIGIDLGTTNSCVSIMEGNTPRVIENSEGNRTTPSVVAYDSSGEILIGVVAKRQAVTNPKNTVSAIKRLMGRRFSDSDIQEHVLKKSSFQIIEAKNGDAWVRVGNKELAPQQISAEILRKMKQTAEDFLGYKISKAVITVPAYFNDAQRQATKDAGQIAGLEVERIINEPTAAALAYGLNNKKEGQKVVVYDLGGGTFDVSIIEVSNVDGENQVEVLSTNGNTFLGGEDFDYKIIDHIVQTFKKESGVDLNTDILAMQRIKEAAEKAKIELSTLMQTKINLPYITVDNTGPKHIDITLTRSKFESLVEDLIEMTIEPCRLALKDANLTTDRVDDVLLIGGQTRTPAVKKCVADFFGRAPRQDMNPDEAVSIGAAIQGAVISGDIKDVLLLDVTPLTLGIETLGGVCTPIIERNTTIPAKRSQIFSTAADNQTSVSIHVLQGERPMAKDNNSLARFDLHNIPAARRGEPQIEVTFDIDVNGILNVSARDMKTNNKQSISVESGSGLSKDQIDRMVQEAKVNEESDKKIAELVKTRNDAEQFINMSEKFISDTKEIQEEDKIAVTDACSKLRSVLDDKDATKSTIEEHIKNLEKVFSAVSAKHYQQQKQADSGDATSSNSSQESQTEEAEVVNE